MIIHDLNTNISVVYYYLSILSSIKYLEENNINHQVNPANYNIRSILNNKYPNINIEIDKKIQYILV